MRIVLNPKYQHLRQYLEHIDEHFEREGRELHRGHNVLRTLQVEGLTLVVKRYGKLPLSQRLATRIYKSNKAKQAYFSPFLLKERGFESPDPVAFVTYRQGWFSATYYFVCLFSDYRYTMKDIDTLEPGLREEVTRCFASYAARLHKRGVLHRDFSAANILFDRIGDRIHFALIDTNSIKCGRSVSVERGCQNFARLEGSPEFIERLAMLYAGERETDPQGCLALITEAQQQYQLRKQE